MGRQTKDDELKKWLRNKKCAIMEAHFEGNIFRFCIIESVEIMAKIRATELFPKAKEIKLIEFINIL